MSDRIKITQLVDLDVKTGKVDSSALERELPKLLQQAFAKIPGAKALIDPEIEVNPRFKTDKIVADLSKILDNPKIKEAKGTAEFERLEKMVVKYSRALEHLAEVSTSTKFSPEFLKNFQKLMQGEVSVDKLSQGQRKQLDLYRNYLNELRKVFDQVQREVTQINDSIGSTELRNASKRLLTAQKAKEKILGKLGSEGLSGGELEKLQRELKKREAKIQTEQANVLALEAEAEKRRRIGALVAPEFTALNRQIVGAIKAIDDAERKSETDRVAAETRIHKLKLKNAEERGRQFDRQWREQEKKRVDEEKRLSDSGRLTKLSQRNIGRAALRTYGDVSAVPQELLPQTIDYLKFRQQATSRAMGMAERQYGSDSEQVMRLAKHYRELGASIHSAKDAAAHAHPILTQMGRVIGQFARYAVGYAALYQFVDGLRSMASAAVDLQDKLKGIQAITGSTTSEMEGLYATIKQVATTSMFSLNDISDAVRTVAQAGVSLKDIPKTVKAVSDLATASGTSLQVAADIITTAQSVWESVSPDEIANKVTQAANASKLSVESLQTIFSLGASFAKGANLSVDQYLAFTAAITNKGVRPSTIATGGGQLFKELFAPDQKFSEFLSRRYSAIGENVSAKDARARFAGFTEEENPLQAVLRELQRIGAGSAEAVTGLRRAIDDRAFRVLQPLLNDPNALQRASAQIQAAPTAQEAARVAMDSLKKATDNLVDQFHVLADTLLKDAIPAVTKLVKGMADGVAKLEEVVRRSQDLIKAGASGGLNPMWSAGLGAVAGATNARGVWKIPAALVGGLAAGSATFLGNTAAVNSERGDAWTAAIDAGITVFTASRIKWVKDLFNRNRDKKGVIDKAVDVASDTLTASSSGFLGKIGKTLSAKLGSRLLLSSWLGPIGLVTSAVMTLFDILGLVGGLFSDSDKAKVDEAKRRRQASPTDFMSKVQEDRAKEAQEQEVRFATQQVNTPLPADSVLGQLQRRQQEREKFRKAVSDAIGATVDAQNEDKLLEDFIKLSTEYPTDNQLRKDRVLELQRKYGGSGEVQSPNVYAASEAASTLRSSLDETLMAMGRERGDLRARGMADLDERQQTVLRAYNTLAKGRPDFDKALDGVGKVSVEEALSAMESFADLGAQLLGNTTNVFQTEKKRVLEAYQRAIDSTKGNADQSVIDSDLANMRQLIAEGVAKYGYDFAAKFRDELPVKGGTDQRIRNEALGAAAKAMADRADKDIAVLRGLQDDTVSAASTIASRPDLDKLVERGNETEAGNVMRLSEIARLIGGDMLPGLIQNLELLRKDAQAAQAETDPTKRRNLFERASNTPYNSSVDALIREGYFSKDGSGNLQLNSQFGILETANKIRKQEDVEPVKKVYEGSVELEDRVREVERLIVQLRNPTPQQLLDSGLIRDKYDAQKAVLEDKRRFLEGQPEDETGQKNRDLNQVTNDIKDLDVRYQREIADLNYQVERLKLETEKRALDKNIQVLRDNRDALTSVGRGSEFTKAEELTALEDKRRQIAEKLIEIRTRNNEATGDEVDATRELLALDERRRNLQAEFDNTEALKARVLSGQNQSLDIRTRRAYLEGVGAAPGTAEQATYLSNQLVGLNGVMSKQQASISDAQSRLATMSMDDPLYSELVKQVERTAASFADTAIQVAKTKAELEDLVPTIATEVSQFSAASIEAKIANLPQSLKNLNSNIEDRIVSALDQLGTVLYDALSESIAGLLGLGETSDETAQALSDLRDAQVKLNDVMTNSLDVAEQISAIRQNETDPVRQEYLINRAMEAQRYSEEIARAQVNEAQRVYDETAANSGFFGSLRSLGSEFFGGIGQDMFKGLFLNLMGGKIGETADKPMYVKDVDKWRASTGADTSSSSSGSWLDKVTSWFTGEDGAKPSTEGPTTYSYNAQPVEFQDQVIEGAADTVDDAAFSFDKTFKWAGDLFGNLFGSGGTVSNLFTGLVSGIKSVFSGGLGGGAGGGGLLSSIVSGAGNLVSGIGSLFGGKIGFGDIFGQVANIGSTLFSYFSSQDQERPVVVQRARGGYISGPGTSTSDSIPARVSNGEYVLNAKTVQSIGRDVLDSWNFSNAKPASFAAGGMVGVAKQAAASRQSPPQPAPAPAQGKSLDSLRVVLVDDNRRVKDFISSAEGERTLVDFVRRNSLSLRQVLQG